VSLYRAVVWVRLLKKRHEELAARDLAWIKEAVDARNVGSFEQGAEMELYGALWHSLLYGVVEIWKSYQISSPGIDSLIDDPRIDLLRGFRNAMLHPRDFADERIDALTEEGNAAYSHYVAIVEAFERFIAPIGEADRGRRKDYSGAQGA